jgi:TetR/AcrR family transcriptional regulator
MRRGTPRVETADDPRAAILEAAELHFARYGLDGARVDAIAADANMTKAMINYYFGSKENLYQAVVDRVYEDRARLLDAPQLATLGAREALRELMQRLIAQLQRRPHLALLFALENARDEPQYRGKKGEATAFIVEIIERGIAAGEFREVDVRFAALNVVSICTHFFNSRQNLRSLWRKEQRADADLVKQHEKWALEFVFHALCR